MSNLKIVSDRIDKIAGFFTANTKFQFAEVKIRDWSLTIKGNPEAARQIFDLCDKTWLRIKQNGDTTMIYDDDVLLNRKFLGIFGKIPQAREAGLTIRIEQRPVT